MTLLPLSSKCVCTQFNQTLHHYKQKVTGIPNSNPRILYCDERITVGPLPK